MMFECQSVIFFFQILSYTYIKKEHKLAVEGKIQLYD